MAKTSVGGVVYENTDPAQREALSLAMAKRAAAKEAAAAAKQTDFDCSETVVEAQQAAETAAAADATAMPPPKPYTGPGKSARVAGRTGGKGDNFFEENAPAQAKKAKKAREACFGGKPTSAVAMATSLATLHAMQAEDDDKVVTRFVQAQFDDFMELELGSPLPLDANLGELAMALGPDVPAVQEDEALGVVVLRCRDEVAAIRVELAMLSDESTTIAKLVAELAKKTYCNGLFSGSPTTVGSLKRWLCVSSRMWMADQIALGPDDLLLVIRWVLYKVWTYVAPLSGELEDGDEAKAACKARREALLVCEPLYKGMRVVDSKDNWIRHLLLLAEAGQPFFGRVAARAVLGMWYTRHNRDENVILRHMFACDGPNGRSDNGEAESAFVKALTAAVPGMLDVPVHVPVQRSNYYAKRHPVSDVPCLGLHKPLRVLESVDATVLFALSKHYARILGMGRTASVLDQMANYLRANPTKTVKKATANPKNVPSELDRHVVAIILVLQVLDPNLHANFADTAFDSERRAIARECWEAGMGWDALKELVDVEVARRQPIGRMLVVMAGWVRLAGDNGLPKYTLAELLGPYLDVASSHAALAWVTAVAAVNYRQTSGIVTRRQERDSQAAEEARVMASLDDDQADLAEDRKRRSVEREKQRLAATHKRASPHQVAQAKKAKRCVSDDDDDDDDSQAMVAVPVANQAVVARAAADVDRRMNTLPPAAAMRVALAREANRNLYASLDRVTEMAQANLDKAMGAVRDDEDDAL